MRDKLLKSLARAQTNHPWRMLLLVFILTVLFISASTRLTITMRWSDLLPSNDPRTLQFNKIIDEFKTSTSLTIVVQGEEEQIKKFADELAPKIVASINDKKNAKIDASIAKLEQKLGKLAKAGKDTLKLAQNIADLLAEKDQLLFQRVDYKANVDFLKKNGLLLIKESDLENTKSMFFS